MQEVLNKSQWRQVFLIKEGVFRRARGGTDKGINRPNNLVLINRDKFCFGSRTAQYCMWYCRASPAGSAVENIVIVLDRIRGRARE